MKIISWRTWKKHNNPTIYTVRDGVKGWSKETINPTLQKNGFILISEDYEYGFSDKTNEWAKREAEFYISYYQKKENYEFVYYFSQGTYGCMNYRALYCKVI